LKNSSKRSDSLRFYLYFCHAIEQGLATCWVCNFDAELCKKSFGLVDNEEAAVLIPIGYPADEIKEKKRKAIDEIVK